MSMLPAFAVPDTEAPNFDVFAPGLDLSHWAPVITGHEFANDSLRLHHPKYSGTKARIVDAARRCAFRYGYHRMTMTQIAEASRLSRAAVYKHFADLPSLRQTVADWSLVNYGLCLQRAMDDRPNLQQQISAAMTCSLEELCSSEGPWYQGASAVAFSNSEQRIIRMIMFAMDPFLRQARARRELRADVELEPVAEWIARSIASVALIAWTSTAESSDAVAAQIGELAMRGLSADAGQRRMKSIKT